VLFACKGRVVVSGNGKSGLIARKNFLDVVEHRHSILFLHPAEALHGDLGMLRARGCRCWLFVRERRKRSSGFWKALNGSGMPLVTLTGKCNRRSRKPATSCWMSA